MIPYSITVIVGSKQWIQYWTEFYWDMACEYANRTIKYPNDELYPILSMEAMFKSYMWKDTKPWA